MVDPLAQLGAKEFHKTACRLLRTQKSVDIADMLGVRPAEYSNVLHGRKGSIKRLRVWVKLLGAHVGIPSLSLVASNDRVEIRPVGVLYVDGLAAWGDDHKILSVTQLDCEPPACLIEASRRGWEHLFPDAVVVKGTADEVRVALE